MGTLARTGLSWIFPLLILQFCLRSVLLHVFLSRSIVIVESLISHNFLSCFLLALVDHVASGEEHLKGT